MTAQEAEGASALSRRALLLNGAAVAALAVFRPATAFAQADATTPFEVGGIRPFRVDIPAVALVDLRQRLAATRWPEPETVDDRSQGVQLAKLQSLVRYWQTDYDWRKGEVKLNALPQFLTNVDGLDIHFIHVRSRHADALPLIMTHGWPGSVFELLKVIGPLTDPTAHGGTAEEAFHLVLPSIPGFGFSEKPKGTGWNPGRIARAWDVLMKRLGYREYVSQGGDWGAIISDAMGRQAPPGLLGIHVNRIERATTIPPEIAKAGLSARGRRTPNTTARPRI
ncbi:epoxide hydrolase, partial [Sinorhizobium sp. BJ1]|uniref:epoxide hydrolase family protein n=1 Tax=Sinorhizobium sp. BJ1 TaxID=2035455 RepID=UPI000BECE448